MIDIYIRLLHLLRFLLGDLSEPFSLGAHDLAIPVTNHLLVIAFLKERSMEPSVFSTIHIAVLVDDPVPESLVTDLILALRMFTLE